MSMSIAALSGPGVLASSLLAVNTCPLSLSFLPGTVGLGIMELKETSCNYFLNLLKIGQGFLL